MRAAASPAFVKRLRNYSLGYFLFKRNVYWHPKQISLELLRAVLNFDELPVAFALEELLGILFLN